MAREEVESMPLRDYTEGSNPGLSNLINNINDQEEQRERAHRENLETAGKVGLAFALGTLVSNILGARRPQ